MKNSSLFMLQKLASKVKNTLRQEEKVDKKIVNHF